jgi:hypothetical protein
VFIDTIIIVMKLNHCSLYLIKQNIKGKKKHMDKDCLFCVKMHFCSCYLFIKLNLVSLHSKYNFARDTKQLCKSRKTHFKGKSTRSCGDQKFHTDFFSSSSCHFNERFFLYLNKIFSHAH